MEHKEYLRRNLVVAKAVGARSGVATAIDRINTWRRKPKWLAEKLEEVAKRQEGLEIELAAWRDAAEDKPK